MPVRSFIPPVVRADDESSDEAEQEGNEGKPELGVHGGGLFVVCNSPFFGFLHAPLRHTLNSPLAICIHDEHQHP